jgi:hypothetical protein
LGLDSLAIITIGRQLLTAGIGDRKFTPRYTPPERCPWQSAFRSVIQITAYQTLVTYILRHTPAPESRTTLNDTYEANNRPSSSGPILADSSSLARRSVPPPEFYHSFNIPYFKKGAGNYRPLYGLNEKRKLRISEFFDPFDHALGQANDLLVVVGENDLLISRGD